MLSKRGATRALPSTSARPRESASFRCSNSRGPSPRPRGQVFITGSADGLGPQRLVTLGHNVVVHETPDGLMVASSHLKRRHQMQAIRRAGQTAKQLHLLVA